MAKVTQVRTPLTKGVVAATLTPMRADNSPELALMADHCHKLRADGSTSIVVLGTTGEANSFAVAERQHILEGLLLAGMKASDLIVGTGCCAQPDTVVLTRHALSLGVERILMLPPFYYKKVSEAGLFRAFAGTIDTVGDDRLRVYLYLIPQMSGIELGVGLIERLLDVYPKTIAGLKDSSGNWPATEVLCRRLGDRMDVLVGTETLLLRALEAGASGCVSATANVNARAIAELFSHAHAPQAREMEKQVNAKRRAFEKYPMIPALKAYLAATTGKPAWRNLRPPLDALSAEEFQRLMGDIMPT
jgi:4-hydroxy-tetrahydrodipicolinate synthase